MIRRVGLIGLGAMGLPMAKCVARKSFDLCVCDLDERPVKELLREFPAVTVMREPYEIGQACDVVITMLPNAETVAQVCSGSRGLFAGMAAGSTWVDMTTGDPFTTEKLAAVAREKGIRCIDSPCGRSPKHAAQGDLLLLIGGEEAVLEEILPLLRAMASDVIRCGNTGAGHTMKLINNLLSGVIQEANVEAISLGLRAGISVSTMLQVFSKVCVWNGYLAALPFEEHDAPGWKVTTAEEHMELVQKLGRKYHVATYTPAVVRARMEEMIAQGKGDTKYSNIMTLLENMEGIKIEEKIIPPTIREH